MSDTRVWVASLIAAALLALGAWGLTVSAGPVRVSLLEPPGRGAVPAIAGDRAVLISGRHVTPAGRVIRTQSYNWGMALSPDESRLALIRADAIEIIDLVRGASAVRIPPYGTKPAEEQGAGTYMGCAFSPDGRLLYVGSADTGEIKTIDLATERVVSTLSIDGDGYRDSFAGDFVLSPDGGTLHVLDQFNYRLVTVDVETGRVRQSVRVGRNPFSLSVSPDGTRAWVTNVGMFEYPLIPGVTEENRRTAGLTFPAYGVPSAEAEQGTVAEGIAVPGLGDPNHPDAMSVFGVDLSSGAVFARVKTGYLVGAERAGQRTIGGSSPGGVAAGRRFVYVSNATNDTVSIIDAATGVLAGEIPLDVPGLESYRGVIPFGVALSPDEQTLYVACAGLNAVAVIDTAARSRARVHPGGLVHVVCGGVG